MKKYDIVLDQKIKGGEYLVLRQYEMNQIQKKTDDIIT